MVQPHIRESAARETVRETTEQELSAVLGRFRAWNSNSSDRRQQLTADLDLPTDAAACLQEISYEEALGARLKTIQPQALSKPKSARETPSTANAMTAPIQEKASRRARKSSATLTTGNPRPPVATGSRKPVAKPKNRQIVSKRIVARTTVTSVTPEAAPSARSSGRNITSEDTTGLPAKVRRPSFQDVLQDSLAVNMSKSSTLADRPPISRIPHNEASRTRPQSKSAANVAGKNWEEKFIAMKLRISAEEHATIQAGASEAGVTIADYMRQCTLDVQVLRTLLNQTISDHNLASMASSSQNRVDPSRASELALRNPDSIPVDPEESFITRLKSLFFGVRRG